MSAINNKCTRRQLIEVMLLAATFRIIESIYYLSLICCVVTMWSRTKESFNCIPSCGTWLRLYVH